MAEEREGQSQQITTERALDVRASLGELGIKTLVMIMQFGNSFCEVSFHVNGRMDSSIATQVLSPEGKAIVSTASGEVGETILREYGYTEVEVGQQQGAAEERKVPEADIDGFSLVALLQAKNKATLSRDDSQWVEQLQAAILARVKGPKGNSAQETLEKSLEVTAELEAAGVQSLKMAMNAGPNSSWNVTFFADTKMGDTEAKNVPAARQVLSPDGNAIFSIGPTVIGEAVLEEYGYPDVQTGQQKGGFAAREEERGGEGRRA